MERHGEDVGRRDPAASVGEPHEEGRTGRGAHAEEPGGGGAAARSVERTRERHTTDHATVEGRQRDEFGGFNLGAAFFGWLVAVGLAALLIALLSAAGAAIGLSEVTGSEANKEADTIGIVGGILVLLVLMLAYYAGGYVAGRMSRFDGARQGLGVWIIGLLITIALAVLGAVAGSEYNVLQQLNLPRIPIDEGDLATGGIIALIAFVLGTLIAALLGGKVGERYHRKVDRAGVGAH